MVNRKIDSDNNDTEGHMPRIGNRVEDADTEGHMPRIGRSIEDADTGDDDVEGNGMRFRPDDTPRVADTEGHGRRGIPGDDENGVDDAAADTEGHKARIGVVEDADTEGHAMRFRP